MARVTWTDREEPAFAQSKRSFGKSGATATRGSSARASGSFCRAAESLCGRWAEPQPQPAHATFPRVSPGRQLAAAAFVWLVGFVLLRRFGTVLPLLAMAVALAAVVAWREPVTRRLLGPRHGAWGAGLLAAAFQIAATYLFHPACVRAWPPLAPEVHRLQGLLFHGQPRIAVGALVVAMSTCEEILFRGRLLEGPRDRVLLGAAFYAAVHATSASPLLVALAFLCGLYWGALRRSTGTLWASIACHVLWDVSVMVVWPL